MGVLLTPHVRWKGSAAMRTHGAKGGATLVRLGIGLAAVSLVAVGATASASTASSQPGSHTVHNGPMTITTPGMGTLKVGSITAINNFCNWPQPSVFTDAVVGFKWSAHSTAGSITSYDVFLLPAGAPPAKVSTQTSTSIGNLAVSNYQGDCGGGSGTTFAYVVVAHDSAGHTVKSANVETFINVDRWNNMTAEQPQGTWTYTGSWMTSTCTCADGGTQTFTTQSGATATYTFTSPRGAGNHIALMMAKGPGRGSFQVFLDGVLKATISTHATANLNRVLVWDSGPLTAAQHVIKLVNLATAGHDRIDVNAAVIEQ
jgi:hypothetical protein